MSNNRDIVYLRESSNMPASTSAIQPSDGTRFILAHLNVSLRKFTRCRNRYRRCYVRWRDNRRDNIALIRQLYIGLELTRHDCNITGLSAGLGGLAGGILTGVGLILLPFSVGGTTPVVITGTVLLVSAGATGLGGAAADIIISKGKCQTAQGIINKDIELTSDLQLLEQEYSRAMQNLASSLHRMQTDHPREYDQFQQYIISGGGCVTGAFRAGSAFIKMVRLARIAHLASIFRTPIDALSMIDVMNPIPFMSIGSKVDDVLEAGARTGVAATKGARPALIASGVLCVVGLVMDVTQVIYSSVQIDKHRRNQEEGVNPDESSIPLIAENTENLTFGKKLKRKITHPFTRKYISERAEKLKNYASVLETELMEMERNEAIQDLAVMCVCRQCTPIGGGTDVLCCHQNELNWNSVRSEKTFLMYNTAALCVTQHPAFSKIYLNEESLKEHFPHLKNMQSSGKFHGKHRILRFSAYTLFMRNTGQADTDRKIPDCVHAAVVHAFPPESLDVWAQEKQDLGIQDLWKQPREPDFIDKLIDKIVPDLKI